MSTEKAFSNLSLTRKLLVADIEDDVLLRIDILMDETDGRADILLSKGVIQLQCHCIPCVTDTEKNVGCIMRSADEFTPPISGTIIPASIERIANTSRQNQNLLLEPFRNFSANSSLLLAPAMINIAKWITVPVRVMNPFKESKTTGTCNMLFLSVNEER